MKSLPAIISTSTVRSAAIWWMARPNKFITLAIRNDCLELGGSASKSIQSHYAMRQ